MRKLNLDKMLDDYEKEIQKLDRKLEGNPGGQLERATWEAQKEIYQKVLEAFGR